jgi:ATP-dependent DNA helicase 2 subunit 2
VCCGVLCASLAHANTCAGFTDTSSIPRQHFLSCAEYFVPDPNDEFAGESLSSLVRALEETESCAIVRYVKRNGAGVKLGALIPHIKRNYDCLIFVALPFSEDLRNYTFASLDPKTMVKRNLVPSEEQLDSAMKLVQSMDLEKAKDRDGNEYEALKPKTNFNPVLQGFYQCLQQRALRPNAPLPKLDAIVANSLDPTGEVIAAAQEQLREFARKFPLEKTAQNEKMQRTWWADAANTRRDIKLDSYAADKEAKKRKVDGEFEADFSMEKLLNVGTNDVGSVNPVQDFVDMISRRDVDLVDKAITQMKELVFKLVNHSIGDQYYDKALRCAQALRAGCIQEEESEEFNKFLREMRLHFENRKRADFWLLIVANKITLVSSDECEDSFVTPADALKFLGSEAAAPQAPEIAKDDADAQDLFDMLE